MFLKNKKLQSFKSSIKENSHHEWILKNRYIWAAFDELLDSLPKNWERELQKQNIIFLRANGAWSLAFPSIKDSTFIVVFDELYKLLLSGAPRLGQAVLAHELGHIFYKHGTSGKDPLEAQVEADLFALQLGYGEELVKVLQDIETDLDHIELRVRISYLTSNLISSHPERYL